MTDRDSPVVRLLFAGDDSDSATIVLPSMIDTVATDFFSIFLVRGLSRLTRRSHAREDVLMTRLTASWRHRN